MEKAHKPMKIKRNRLILINFLVCWLVAAVLIFMDANRTSYLHQLSFTNWEAFVSKSPYIPLASFIFDILFSFAGVTIFSLLCMGVGLVILRYAEIPETSSLAKGVTAFVAGEILFSVLFLSIISVTALSPTLTGIIFVLSGIICTKPLYRFIADRTRRLTDNEWTPGQKGILGAITVIMTLSLLLTSARLGYDAVSDYFSQAKLMASVWEASSFFPDNHMIVSSLHLDILFTILIQMFGDQAARMLSWVNGLAILITGCEIARRNGFPTNARLNFLVLMLTTTAFTDLLGDGKVELISTAPILVAIYWLPISMKSPSRNLFLLIGALAGFSIISRLYNIFIVSVFVAIYYLIALAKSHYPAKTEQARPVLEELKTFAAKVIWLFPTFFGIGFFHIWQNWVWLGSPLAPLEFADNLRSSNWEWKFDPGLLNMLRALYPLTVTFLNSAQSLGTVTPLFIGFLPFVMFKEVRSRLDINEEFLQLLLTSIITLAAWILFFYTIVEIRYVLFIWVLLLLPLGQLMDHIFETQPKLFLSISKVMIGSLMSFIALRIAYISIAAYSPIDSNGQAHCSGIAFCDFFDPINEQAAPGDRVFALNAYRYYFRNDLFDCSTRAHEYIDLKNLATQNSAEFWVELYRRGYRYVAFEGNFSLNHSRFGAVADPGVAPSWLNIVTISSDQVNVSYRLDAKSPPFQPEISCQKNDNGIWILNSTQ